MDKYINDKATVLLNVNSNDAPLVHAAHLETTSEIAICKIVVI